MPLNYLHGVIAEAQRLIGGQGPAWSAPRSLGDGLPPTSAVAAPAPASTAPRSLVQRKAWGASAGSAPVLAQEMGPATRPGVTAAITDLQPSEGLGPVRAEGTSEAHATVGVAPQASRAALDARTDAEPARGKAPATEAPPAGPVPPPTAPATSPPPAAVPGPMAVDVASLSPPAVRPEAAALRPGHGDHAAAEALPGPSREVRAAAAPAAREPGVPQHAVGAHQAGVPARATLRNEPSAARVDSSAPLLQPPAAPAPAMAAPVRSLASGADQVDALLPQARATVAFDAAPSAVATIKRVAPARVHEDMPQAGAEPVRAESAVAHQHAPMPGAAPMRASGLASTSALAVPEPGARRAMPAVLAQPQAFTPPRAPMPTPTASKVHIGLVEIAVQLPPAAPAPAAPAAATDFASRHYLRSV